MTIHNKSAKRNLDQCEPYRKKNQQTRKNYPQYYTIVHTFLRINDYEGTNIMNFCRVRRAILKLLS